MGFFNMSYESKGLIKLLKQNGWSLDRVNGSHHIFIKGDKTIVISHPKKDIKKGLYNAILKQAGLK